MTDTIETERLILRPLQLTDANETYLSWLNDPKVKTGIISETTSLSQLKNFVEEKIQQKDCVFWGVFEKESQKHIGNIKFEPINQDEGHTNFGLLFAPDSGGKGYAFEACAAANEDIFNRFGLNKINLSVFSDNQGAIKLYRKMGFVDSGQREYQGREVLDMVLTR